MLSGYNTNVKHRGVLFHVQTEDSGVRNPHVITHLYHQGTILASEKSEYRHLLDQADDLESAVKGQMEGQHKEMLRRLRRGVFDELIDERLGPDAGASDATGSTTQPEAPSVIAEPTPTRVDDSPRSFGQGIVSQKPLDEVVLEYLVDSARKRKRRP